MKLSIDFDEIKTAGDFKRIAALLESAGVDPSQELTLAQEQDLDEPSGWEVHFGVESSTHPT